MEPMLRSTQLLKQEAEDISLKGKEVAKYVREQQALDREERIAWRDVSKDPNAELQAEDKKKADEIHMVEMQVHAEAEEKKRADEIKIQIAKIEAAKEQAKIEADKELTLKELKLKAQQDQASISLAAVLQLLYPS